MKPVNLLFILLWAVGAVAQTVAPPPPGHEDECVENLIFRKWNDLLFVNNGELQYTSFQWYRDSVPVPGATSQYLHEDGVPLSGDGHIYYAKVTTTAGKTLTCCAYLFDDFPASQPLNPVKTAKKAALYSSTGRKIGEWSERPTTLSLAPGCYIWHLTNEEGESWIEKEFLQ